MIMMMSTLLSFCAMVLLPFHHSHVVLLCIVSVLCTSLSVSSSNNVTGLNDVTKATAFKKLDAGPPSVKNSSHLNGAKSRTTSLLLSAMSANTRNHWLSSRPNSQGDATTDIGTHSPVTSESQSDKDGKSNTWYSTAGWLPSKGIQPDRSVNLAVLPMLAFAFFVFGVCIKCYSWVRDQDRNKARGQLDFEDDDDINYGIITAGEQGYREVDFRSDSTSMYDTITSFRSIRLPVNDHTVTSVKSLPNQPYDTYRSIILQRADEGVYDSVHSYKAFLEKSIEVNEVDIEVELVSDYTPRPRSKSYDQCLERTTQEANRSRRKRLRHHSGGRGLEGNVKTQTERERFRRHSDKSTRQSDKPTPFAAHPESIRSKTFHRRSSPAILEPLLQGAEFKIPLEQSDEEEDGSIAHLPQNPLDRQSSNSSSSTGRSSSSSRQRKESSHKQRREKLRQKRVSQDRLAERAIKGSSHSSGHCSDDSPQSSASSHGSSSSNDLDSESDVTDSGLVVDLQFKPAKQSCFKNTASRDTSRSQSPRDLEEGSKNFSRKVHRFKVSFVDDATLSATSD